MKTSMVEYLNGRADTFPEAISKTSYIPTYSQLFDVYDECSKLSEEQ